MIETWLRMPVEEKIDDLWVRMPTLPDLGHTVTIPLDEGAVTRLVLHVDHHPLGGPALDGEWSRSAFVAVRLSHPVSGCDATGSDVV